jgi:hypothetical protein
LNHPEPLEREDGHHSALRELKDADPQKAQGWSGPCLSDLHRDQ